MSTVQTASKHLLNRPHITKYSPKKFRSHLFSCFEAYNSQKEKSIKGQLEAQKSKVQKYASKLSSIVNQIKSLKVSWHEGSEVLFVRRNFVLLDTLNQINDLDFFKELKINFENEVSNDAGGLLKEWFTLVFEEVFSSSFGLFIVSDNADFTFNINPSLEPSFENMQLFYSIGRLMGKALLDNVKVSLCLNLLLFKMILEEKIEISDLQVIDSVFYKSVQNVKKSEVKDLNVFYEIDVFKDGKLVSVELFPGGSEQLVTDLEDYMRKRIDYFIEKSLIFVESIRSGLSSVVPLGFLNTLNAAELELLFNGQALIDVEDWERNTVYENYTKKDKTIKIFWKIMKTFNQEELKQCLVFATGTSRVPIGGFRKLESSRDQIYPFKIVRTAFGESVKYLKSHTCFNRIDLPNITDEEEMREAILISVQNMDAGFGLE